MSLKNRIYPRTSQSLLTLDRCLDPDRSLETRVARLIFFLNLPWYEWKPDEVGNQGLRPNTNVGQADGGCSSKQPNLVERHRQSRTPKVRGPLGRCPNTNVSTEAARPGDKRTAKRKLTERKNRKEKGRGREGDTGAGRQENYMVAENTRGGGRHEAAVTAQIGGKEEEKLRKKERGERATYTLRMGNVAKALMRLLPGLCGAQKAGRVCGSLPGEVR